MPRLKARFQKEVAPTLMKEFDLKNPMAVPHLHKIVVNMGVGEATQNAKVLDPAVHELGQITGQKPVVTRAKKSIAAFKVREGQAIGAMVTLRGDRMYEFFDRLVNVVLPRVRDFKAVSYTHLDVYKRQLRMVSARAFATAHPSCGYRLWFHGSADHLRRNWREVLGL